MSKPAVSDDTVEEFKTQCAILSQILLLLSSFLRVRVELIGRKLERSCSCHLCVRVFTCVLVPALADMRCRVRRGAISPRQEQGCSFYCEETLTDTGRGEKKKIHEYKFQILQGYLIISGLSCNLCTYKSVLHLLSLSCTC